MDKVSWSAEIYVRPTFRTEFRADFRIDSRIDKYYQVVLSNW